MHKYLYTLLLALCFPLAYSSAQKTDSEDHKNELAMGLGLQGRKFQFSLMYARHFQTHRTLFAHVDLTEIRSDKERRVGPSRTGASPAGASPYIYGKRNQLYIARLGIGQKHFISEKKNAQSITMSLSYQGGIVLGALKPYYLNLVYRSDSTFYTSLEPYTPENSSVFLNPNSIIGAGRFSDGWDALQIMPGLFAKSAFWVDFAAHKGFVTSIEAGFAVDAFARRVPIMVLSESSPVMLHIYVNFYFGGRW